MENAAFEQLVLENFGLCIIAFMIIVALHLMGLHACLREFHSRFRVVEIPKLRYHQTILIILSAMMLLFILHLFTNFCWGWFIAQVGATPSFRQGVYYSLENYTSLGLTRVDVGDKWRMLAPMISLSGVFCLSWSTAVLVSFFNQLYSVKLDN